MALSYQHEYHAGNHADVLKHITLMLILQSLCKKEKPFTLIDTHAGAGKFSLSDERLLKTGEAEGGIKKLISFKEANPSLPQGIEDYLSLEKKYLSKGDYAGSAEIERSFLRKGDIAHFVEKHPGAYESLAKNMDTPTEGKVLLHKDDAYKTLKALTPPLIKRGLILCDPSFEDDSDYKDVTKALLLAHNKWNTAIISLWYPLLLRRKNETSQMLVALEDGAKLGTNPCESISFELKTKEADERLYGSGMFIINPPWGLSEKMNAILPVLQQAELS